MKIDRKGLYAVLTGDIVGSSRLKEKQRLDLHKTMVLTSRELRMRFAKIVPLPVDIYRGDSWQFIVKDPAKALRIGLFFRAYIRSRMQSKKIDTRVAIGIGAIDFVPDNKILRGDGQAFRKSGGALEKLPRGRRMILDCPDSIPMADRKALDAMLHLIDVLVKNWTEKQAQAVSGALLGWTQEKIASRWVKNKISQQAVAQHLDRAGWNALESGLNYFEMAVERVASTNIGT
jgi:hypothetical protein